MKKVYFVCFTAYQLFVCLYYARKLNKQNARLVLIWFDDNQADVYRFNKLFEEIHVIKDEYATNVNKYITRLKIKGYLANRTYKRILGGIPNNSVVLFFSDEHYPSNRIIQICGKGKGNKTILIEEGIGTYSFHNHSFSLKLWFSELLFGCRGEKNIGVSPLITSFIVKAPEALPRIKHRGRPVIQQNTMFDDKDWIKSLNVLSDESKSVLNKLHEKKILWLGQPLFSDREKINDEMVVVNKILQRFSSEYQTIIKKHPRDDKKKYKYLNGDNFCNYFVDHETWLPAEILVSEIDPDIIISPFSSSAINLYKLGFGKKIIFCYKLFSINIDDSWLEKYKNNSDIYNVSSFDELKMIIQNIGNSPKRINTQNQAINDNKDIDYLNSLISGSAI